MEAVWREGLKRFSNAEFLRKQFERAAKVDDEETRISVCESIPNEWTKDLLAPFLKDTRKLARWSDGTRMCDLAAAAIKYADQSLHFDRDVGAEARDKQIEVLYHHCTGLGRPTQYGDAAEIELRGRRPLQIQATTRCIHARSCPSR